MKNRQETPCQRLAWVVALAAATFTSPSWAFALAPPDQRVDFAKHGSDWVQGNCGSRKQQSPIDLNEMFKPPGGTFKYKYDEVFGQDVEIVNDGRMLSAALVNTSFPGGLALTIAGVPTWFKLTSIDIKSESEHTIRGKHFPLEIQLVHRPAHLYESSTGPESVTVTIFVDCNTPPKTPQVWPGLLQTGARPRKQLRGTALVQQSPEESDALLPEAGEEEEDIDDDPMHQRMNGEVNFVRTLVEGEDALAASPAAAPAAAPGPAGAPGAPGSADAVYSPPSPMQPNYNPLLQFLVAQEPPDLDSSVITGIGPNMPLRLGALLGGGTYFNYWGSSTLPPCKEADMWLIKREVLMASNEQVKALYDTLHLMSSGAGNFRTSMPINRRAIPVLAGEEGIPRELQPEKDSHEDEMPGHEQKYIDVAKDAITIAKAASDYAKDLDWRLQAGATAHLRAMQAVESTTAPPTTSAYIPAPPEDQMWATKIMTNIVKKGIHDALKANIDEMIPATVSLTSSYLRQRLLKKAGFGRPPLGAVIIPPVPIPGVPTFFPPNAKKLRGMAHGHEAQHDDDDNHNASLDALLIAANCTEAANFSGCGNVTGLTAAQAMGAAQAGAAHAAEETQEGEDGAEDEDTQEANQMTPEMIATKLPTGVQPVPADWPDPDAWPNGLPPANWPTGADPSVWPNPDGAKPSGWSAYQWERYQYNWKIYRSSYQPYQSTYRSAGYSLSRRRRMSSSYSSRRRSSSSSSYSSRRRSSSYSRSSSRSSGRRRSSSYSSSRSSSRRRSYR